MYITAAVHAKQDRKACQNDMCFYHQCRCFSLYRSFINNPFWRLNHSDGSWPIHFGPYASYLNHTRSPRNGRRILSPLSNPGERCEKYVGRDFEFILWSRIGHCTSIWLNSELVYWFQTHNYALSGNRLCLCHHFLHLCRRSNCIQKDIQKLHKKRRGSD